MTIENASGFFLLDVPALRRIAANLEEAVFASSSFTLTAEECAVVLSALPTTEPETEGES